MNFGYVGGMDVVLWEFNLYLVYVYVLGFDRFVYYINSGLGDLG